VALVLNIACIYFAACRYSAGHTESKIICGNIDDKRCRGSPVVIGWLSPKLQICIIWSMSVHVSLLCIKIELLWFYWLLSSMNKVVFGSLKWCKTRKRLLLSKLWTITTASLLMKVSIYSNIFIHSIGCFSKFQNV